MQISVELTLTPLQNDFEEHIICFIKRLRDSKFKILENPLSTQIYGEYDEVMSFLTPEIKRTFGDMESCLSIYKVSQKQ